jgi:hypothetical protein
VSRHRLLALAAAASAAALSGLAALAVPNPALAGTATAPLTQAYVEVSNGGPASAYTFANVVSGQEGRTIELQAIANPGPGASTVELQITPPTGKSVGDGTFTSGEGWNLNIYGTNNGIPQCEEDLGTVSIDHATFDAEGNPVTMGARFHLQCSDLIPAVQPTPTVISGAIALGVAPTAVGQGYYLYGANGKVTGFGNDSYLNYLGDLSGTPLNKPVVGMAITPDGAGYWLVASDGGIFAFGDAAFHGSMGGARLNKPIVGMAATPDGNGYWLVASDGGIFAFGDAAFHGSTGAIHLNKPIVGMAATPDGNGYWLVASDGGIFAFGDAAFHGSAGATHLNQPIVGMAATPDGNGYWLVAADGGVFSYGDGPPDGSLGGTGLTNITGITH